MTRSAKLIVLVGGALLAALAVTPLAWSQAPGGAPPAGAPEAGPAAAGAPAAGSAAPASSASAPRSGMAFLFPVMLILIFLGCVALTYAEGMWANAIRLINVVTAGLLAVNFWEAAARMLEGFAGSFTYYCDFLALWGLFAVFMLIGRSVTGALSKVKVKFKKVVDDAGGWVFAAWAAWVVVCFTTFTLHTAPLARNFMFGGFDPDSRMLMGLAPDRQWLGFAMRVSRGTFCRYATEQESQQGTYGAEADPSSADQKLCVFDREARFIAKYAARRAALEKHVAEKHATRVDGGAPKR